jgi:hypothetical protein
MDDHVPVPDHPAIAFAIVARLQANARAMVQSADALQAAIEQGIQGPFNGGLNALPNGTAGA